MDNKIESFARVYNSFYGLLYNDIIPEDSISLTVAEESINDNIKYYRALCEYLQDVLISDREKLAFMLAINFISELREQS